MIININLYAEQNYITHNILTPRMLWLVKKWLFINRLKSVGYVDYIMIFIIYI